MEHLDNLITKVRKEVSSINNGGCAIFALALYRYLKKTNQLKGDEKFVYLYREWDEDSYKTNEYCLKGDLDPEYNVMSCTHACLYHNGVYIDSNGELITARYDLIQEIPVSLEKDFLVNSLNKGGWNWMFERDWNIPIIERILKVDLSDIDR